MEELHAHCVSCMSRRCMVKPEPGISCDLLACPLVCGAVFHSCKLAEHRLLCPLERVPCLNCSIGCPFFLTRGTIAEHLEVCPAGVVCCTMEWNRWPVNYENYHSYERLSQDAVEEEQLDMALALQDQRTMLASLKLVSLAPTRFPERKAQLKDLHETPSVSADVMVPTMPLVDATDVSFCPKDIIASGINGLNEEYFGDLYQTTVETTKSLSAALNVLTHLNTTDKQCTTTRISGMQPELNGELCQMLVINEDNGSNCDKIISGISGLNEDLQPQQHHTLMELGRNLASALGALGDAVKGIEPSCIINGEIHRSERAECSDIEMINIPSENEVNSWVDEGIIDMNSDKHPAHINEEFCQESSIIPEDEERHSLELQKHTVKTAEIAECSEHGDSWDFVDPLVPHIPEVRHDLATVVMQETSGSQVPPLQPTDDAQALDAPRDIVFPPNAIDFEDMIFERKLQNLRLLRNFMPLALNKRKGCFTESVPYRQSHYMMDKAVDTSDLVQELQDDPLGLGEIDFTASALLFCLEESPRARRISDTVFAIGGSHVDFGTQTFSFPAAILATSTMVGEVASASACDRAAPRLSQPSPFCTLRLDLTLEQLVPRPSWAPREGSMFTFECGQLFRRDEFLSHFRNVHGDIHSGLNGWLEHRCPLAYYGCTYSQRRLCPSRQGSMVVHNRHLRSFGVRPQMTVVTEVSCDRLSTLPFEILQHVARFLDGFSLCQLSMVSRTMRDVCASLLQTRGMVVVQWEKRQYPDGRQSWIIKDKVWQFSTAFSPVTRWEFTDISSMADHLKRCPYNEVHRQMEAVPLPCMCTTRELTRGGRSLRSVLKPVL